METGGRKEPPVFVSGGEGRLERFRALLDRLHDRLGPCLRWPGTRVVLRRTGQALLGAVALAVLTVLVLRWVNPPWTPYVAAERARLGEVAQVWVPLEAVSEDLRRAVLAAEDAKFCDHWGFDLAAIRAVLDSGGSRGASTLSQQVVKNVFLWQDRSWVRKGIEAGLTVLVEVLWPKRRILEVYLNVAEFGEGVFGAEAAAQAAWGRSAADLVLWRAAAMAVVLPNPKERRITAPTAFLQQRAAAVADGARTLQAEGRAACVEG